MYDLIIRNGTIYDGRGGEPFIADLAVQDKKIVKIGAITDKGKLEIDAKDKIVTPGFVDIHYYIVESPLESETAKFQTAWLGLRKHCACRQIRVGSPLCSTAHSKSLLEPHFAQQDPRNHCSSFTLLARSPLLLDSTLEVTVRASLCSTAPRQHKVCTSISLSKSPSKSLRCFEPTLLGCTGAVRRHMRI